MLEWRTLSIPQKTGAVFLALLFLFSGPPLVIFTRSPDEMLKIADGLRCVIGVLLNPASFAPSAARRLDHLAIFGGFAAGGFGNAVPGKLMRPVQPYTRSDWPDTLQFIVNTLAASRTAPR